MKPVRPSRIEETLLILVAVPILGVLMSGVYSLPTMKLTKERDPGLTWLLGIGLGITVFGLGHAFHVPLLQLVGAWGFSLLLLIVARRIHGSLGHSLERFGMVHAAALLITAVLCVAAAHARARRG